MLEQPAQPHLEIFQNGRILCIYINKYMTTLSQILTIFWKAGPFSNLFSLTRLPYILIYCYLTFRRTNISKQFVMFIVDCRLYEKLPANNICA